MSTLFLEDESLNVNCLVVDDGALEKLDVVVEVVDDVNEDVSLDECDEIAPKIGMKFSDENEVFEFYKRHAYRVGFPVRKRSSRKGEDGLIRYATYTCAREGRRCSLTSGSLKPQPTIQSGCHARLTAMAEISGMWVVTKVILEHNHRTSPSKSRLYRCNRQISEQAKRRLELNDIAGIPMHKSFNSAVVEAGGYDQMTYIEKDCRNYIDKVRRLRLGEGDAVAIQTYFSKMQASCPGFYFSVDLDEECRLRNVFWCDNRCREAYKEFGDVVTFDTTYLTNKYDMPFAPFVGVNHHGQSMLLGCGLLSNEDTETFVWIFRSWLECMEGQAPMGIITDQDRAMQNAIEIVFPNTRHRWCLWHILKKLPEKFGFHSRKASILSSMHNVVYDSQDPEQFDEGWTSMINMYSLQDNAWLAGLYRERCRWVPCFLRTNFWAGMSTTQRSESINAFFDGYVHSKTSLKQFVEQYELALRCKVEKEFQADFKSYSQMLPCVTKFHMEKQFQTSYTMAKFKEFQTEFTGVLYCRVTSKDDDWVGTKYVVEEQIFYDGGEKMQYFTVTFEQHQMEKICCSCHLFEFKGIVCRHSIAVLRQHGVTSIADKYILRRWRRDVSRHYMRLKINYDGWISTPEQVRYDNLCRTFRSVADVASGDDQRTQTLMDWLEHQMDEMKISRPLPSNGSNKDNQSSPQLAPFCGGSNKDSSGNILDPKCSRTKGAPRKLRKKSSLELMSKKPKGSQKRSKGKNIQQNALESGQHIMHVVQDATNNDPSQMSYQQLMAMYALPTAPSEKE